LDEFILNEIPVFAETYFLVNRNDISQNLFFYYYDRSEVYQKFNETGALKGELETIQSNLQYWIDQDDLYVNQRKIRMVIKSVKVDFIKEDFKFPVLFFQIASEEFKQHNASEIIIDLYAQPESLPYSAISVWSCLSGNIVKVVSKTYHQVSQDRIQVIFYMSQSEFIGGSEKIHIVFNK